MPGLSSSTASSTAATCTAPDEPGHRDRWRNPRQVAGAMFWFTWKRLSGSYRAFTWVRRS